MAGRSAADFVCDVLVQGLGISGVVVGPDFEFGRGRGGNLTSLRYMGEMEGFSVTGFDMVTAAQDAGAAGPEKISSTRIRDLVTEYIDLILLAAVGGTAVITLWHYFAERRKVRREHAVEGDTPAV